MTFKSWILQHFKPVDDDFMAGVLNHVGEIKYSRPIEDSVLEEDEYIIPKYALPYAEWHVKSVTIFLDYELHDEDEDEANETVCIELFYQGWTAA